MDTFRTRTLSSGDNVAELVAGSALHERSIEHTSRMNGLVWSSGALPTTALDEDDEDSDEHSVNKKSAKEFSCWYTFLSTLLFCVAWITENILNFELFRTCRASVSFYWLESCVIALFFRFWGRKRIRSFRSQASHFLPLLFLHVAVVTVFSVDYNQSIFEVSGGSESYLVSLALSPPSVMLASWVTYRQCYPDKVIMLIAAACSLIMVLLCAQTDSYSTYRVSYKDGAYGIVMSVVLGFYVVLAKRYLPKASCAELLYLLNFSCMVCLPVIAMLLGELSALQDEVWKRGKLELVFNLSVLGVLRLASQAAFLFHLKYSTPLLNVATRGFAWIWITIAISILSPGHRGVLLLAVFLSFWIYGLFVFLPVLISDLVWRRKAKSLPSLLL